MDSNYSYLNDRYQRVFEKQHGNLVGKHYSVTIHKDDQEICRSVSEQAFRNPDNVFPAILRKHDGKGGYIITQWEYKAMFDQDNSPAGIFCIGHDITEYMQNSIELKSARESLHQTKFTLAQIAYIQSHVVRKPIANIMGLNLLLETMEIEEPLRGIISMINESAKELDSTIKNIATML